MTSTSALLLEADRRRPRSKQTRFGMSELGGCRRRAGYRLAGTPPTSPGGSIQAVLGTAIHTAISSVLEDVAEPDDLVEYAVEFAGILGRIDRYEADTRTLCDVKSTTSRWMDHLKLWGPDRSHRWQVFGYAAALISEGIQVDQVRIDYIARDTGEEWTWSSPFKPEEVREALTWVAEVRATPLNQLPRDYAPDSPFCSHCPFLDVCWDGATAGRDLRTVLFNENPDAAVWVGKLEKARAAKKAAAEEEETAAKALQALVPSMIESGAQLVDVGLPDRVLSFTVSYSKRLDTSAVKAEYAKAGAEPPYKTSEKPTVTVKLAAKPKEKP